MTSITARERGLRCKTLNVSTFPSQEKTEKKKRFPKEELVKTAAGAAATRKQGTH